MKASRSLALLVLPSLVLAEEAAQEPARLPEIVVTPTRRAADPFEVPYSVTVLGDDRLQQERPPRQLPDVLAEVPGVLVQKTSYGQASPFIRGFTGFRTLLMVDGIRVNNGVFRAGPNQYWSTVDSLSIARMELVKGPASALYGSDAVGGTLNAFTRKRDPKDGGGWERRAFTRLSTAEHSNLERLEASGIPAKDLGVFAGVSRKDFGDLRGGKDVGGQPYTGYDERDWDANLVYRFNPDTALTLAHQFVRQDGVPRTHTTVWAKTFYGTAPGTDLLRELDQERQLTYLRLDADAAGTFFDQGTFILSRQLQYEQQDRIQAAALDVQGFTVETYGVSGQLVSPTSAGTFTYGGEWYRDTVDSFRGNFNAAGALLHWRPRGPVADDATYETYGFYVQDEIPLGKAWELTLGTRYTHVQATAFTVADPFDSLAAVKNAEAVHRQWDDLSSSGRLLWRWTEHTHPYAGVSQGFRAPNLSDLTQFDAARSGEVNVPSPGLDPEEYLTKEIGVKHRRAGLAWGAAYYHTEIDDAIERAPTGDLSGTSKVVQRRNVGKGYVQGVELEGSAQPWRDWTLFGNAQWQEGTVDTFVTSLPQDQDRRPMSRIAPRALLLGVRRDFWAQRRGWAEATGGFTYAQGRISPDDALDTTRIPPGGTPGYNVFNLRAGLEAAPGVNVTLALENVADKDYRVLGSGTNAPGRNLILSVDARF